MPTRSWTTEGGYSDPLSTLHDNSVDSRKSSPPWTFPIISSYVPIVSLIFSPLHQGLTFSWVLPLKSYKEQISEFIFVWFYFKMDFGWNDHLTNSLSPSHPFPAFVLDYCSFHLSEKIRAPTYKFL